MIFIYLITFINALKFIGQLLRRLTTAKKQLRNKDEMSGRACFTLSSIKR